MPDDIQMRVLDARDVALLLTVRTDGTADMTAHVDRATAIAILRDYADALEAQTGRTITADEAHGGDR